MKQVVAEHDFIERGRSFETLLWLIKKSCFCEICASHRKITICHRLESVSWLEALVLVWILSSIDCKFCWPIESPLFPMPLYLFWGSEFDFDFLSWAELWEGKAGHQGDSTAYVQYMDMESPEDNFLYFLIREGVHNVPLGRFCLFCLCSRLKANGQNRATLLILHKSLLAVKLNANSVLCNTRASDFRRGY